MAFPAIPIVNYVIGINGDGSPKVRPALIMEVRDAETSAADLLVFNNGSQDGLAWDAPIATHHFWVGNLEPDAEGYPVVNTWFAPVAGIAPA